MGPVTTKPEFPVRPSDAEIILPFRVESFIEDFIFFSFMPAALPDMTRSSAAKFIPRSRANGPRRKGVCFPDFSMFIARMICGRRVCYLLPACIAESLRFTLLLADAGLQ